MRFKDQVARFSEKMGLINLLGRVLRPKANQAAILVYHRIGANGNPAFSGLPQEDFYRQISWLKQNCDVVSLTQLTADVQAGRDLRGKIALTFDDGYADFFRFAFPILHAYNLPATVFVTVDFLNGQIPWFDKLRYMLFQTRIPRLEFPANGGMARFPLQNSAERLAAYRILKRVLGGQPPAERRRCLLDLQVLLQIEDFLPLVGSTMSWEQVQLVSKAGIDIGGHTLTHPFLSEIGPEEQQREISLCKQQLEYALGREVRHFCYPTGKAEDFDGAVENMVRAAGFQSACSSEIGYVQPGDPPFRLKRLYTTEPYLAKFVWRLPA